MRPCGLWIVGVGEKLLSSRRRLILMPCDHSADLLGKRPLSGRRSPGLQTSSYSTGDKTVILGPTGGLPTAVGGRTPNLGRLGLGLQLGRHSI